MSESSLANVQDVNFSFRSLTWKISWDRMTAIDSAGRLWQIKKDSEKLYLNFHDSVYTTITCDFIYKSYEDYKSKFVNKWITSNLIE